MLNPVRHVGHKGHAADTVKLCKAVIIIIIIIIIGDTRETSHLYQRVSVLVQRFNAVLLHDSLPVPDCTD